MSHGFESGGAGWQPPVDPSDGTTPPAYHSAVQGTPPSWTPLAQPGIIPLRPLTLGTLLSASFRTLRRNPRPLIGLALGSQALLGVITVAVLGIAFFASFMRLENVSAENSDEIAAGTVVGFLLANLVPAILGVVVVALLQGIVVLEVTRATLGEKLTLRQLWGRARGRFWVLIGWTGLLVLIAILGLALLAAIVVIFVAIFGAIGAAFGVPLAILGGLGMLVLSVWIGTKLSLVPSALMVERLRLGAALRRSWRLTDRMFWRTFGIQALVGIILNVAIQVAATPLSLLAPMLMFIIDPNSTESDLALGVVLGVYALMLAIIVGLTALAMVVQSAANGLIYLDLRMRKEGLELDLARYVEERDAGTSSLDDPYLPRSADAPTSSWQAPGSPSPWQ